MAEAKGIFDRNAAANQQSGRAVAALCLGKCERDPRPDQKKSLGSSGVLLFSYSPVESTVVPSPVVLFTVICSPEQGREPGLVSTLATGLGDFCHVLAATAGLSALLL